MSTILGNDGERRAKLLLEATGYEILAKNFRTRFGEIDLIAIRDSKVHFVEVKNRQDLGYGSGDEFITKKKLLRIKKTALAYLYSRGQLDCEWQIDAIIIDRKKKTVDHLANVYTEGVD